MHRRHFLSLPAAAPLALAAAPAPHQYHLRYAPSMNMGGWSQGKLTLEQQLEFYAQWGFRQFEFNGLPGQKPEAMASLRRKMDDLGMRMGVFVVNRGGWKGAAMCDKVHHAAFLEDVKRAVEIHKIMDNEAATVCSGLEQPNLSFAEQNRNTIDVLKRAADIVAPTRLVLVLEPLNIRVDHAGYFVVFSEHGAGIMDRVGSPNVKLLFDMYHQQISEGNLINHIKKHYNQIGYMQVGDVPGRREPGTGEVNWQNVFKAIHGLGFKGILGMEHGLTERSEAGLVKCFEAYRKADAWPA